MSNTERDPAEIVSEPGGGTGVEVIVPREVPLGGLRAMRVRRTLPSRQRSLVGAWCFVDHYGPDEISDTGGMSVAPHPHTGLQTVSWLFTGEVEHRDSDGHQAMVRPGELNLMTAAHGISHSEVSAPSTTTLHGVQLWVALTEGARNGRPGFEHYAPTPVRGAGWEARVFLGSLLGETSPVPTSTPLLGAEVLLEAGARLRLDVDAGFEHAVLVDTGAVTVDAAEVARGELGCTTPGSSTLEIAAAEDSRVLVLGGPPFGEQIMMWWNFVGRSHDEIVAFRDEWQRQIATEARVLADPQEVAAGRFGVVAGAHLPPIPAPELPKVRLKLRGRTLG